MIKEILENLLSKSCNDRYLVNEITSFLSCKSCGNYQEVLCNLCNRFINIPCYGKDTYGSDNKCTICWKNIYCTDDYCHHCCKYICNSCTNDDTMDSPNRSIKYVYATLCNGRVGKKCFYCKWDLNHSHKEIMCEHCDDAICNYDCIEYDDDY